METTNIRELKARTSAILRRVREEGVAYDVTHRGKLGARIVPAEETGRIVDLEGTWAGVLSPEQVEQLDRAVDEVKAEVEEQLERMAREIGKEMELEPPRGGEDAR